MWRFHRYYLREMLLNLGMTFCMLFGIALLALLARGITRTQGQAMLLALWVTLLWAGDIVPDLIAISTLIATVFTFSRAASDNEITAIRMAGVSPLRLLGSVLIVGTLTASLNTYLVHNLIPTVHYHKYRPVQELAKQFMMNLQPSNNRIEFGDRLSMTWQRQEAGRYVDVTIKAAASGASFEGFARRVWFESDERGRQIFLKLQGPESYGTAMDSEGGLDRTAAKLAEDTILTFRFDLEELAPRRSEGVKDLPTSQLVAEYRRGGSDNPDVTRWTIWNRTSKGLVSLLFALVAFPIGVLTRRSGRMAALSFGTVPLLAYYVTFYLAPAVARGTGAVWPVALPALVLLALTWVLMRRAFRV